jgi:hypothetical protein
VITRRSFEPAFAVQFGVSVFVIKRSSFEPNALFACSPSGMLHPLLPLGRFNTDGIHTDSEFRHHIGFRGKKERKRDLERGNRKTEKEREREKKKKKKKKKKK